MVSMELRSRQTQLTRNDIASIHRVLILDEAKAVHHLDLSDLPGAMGREVGFDVGLGR